LLHVSDLSWTQKVSHPSEVVEKGQEVEVKILAIDPAHEKISVGLKQLQIDPWQKLLEKLKVGTDVEAEIAKLVSFGAFARLEGGVEGLVHVSEIDRDVQKPEDVLNVGDKVTARVISIDAVERKIGLSIRAFKENEEVKLREEYGKSGSETPVSVRDAVGESVPASLLSAGGTLADAANELMAAVRTKAEAGQGASAVESDEGGVVEPPASPGASEEPDSGS
jgi:small subunit ribosomal protein S1